MERSSVYLFQRRFFFLFGALAFLTSCKSFVPIPPTMTGLTWSRQILDIHDWPRPIQTPRAAITGTRNLSGPYILASKGFLYRLQMEVKAHQKNISIVCDQKNNADAPYHCQNKEGTWSLRLTEECRSGILTIEKKRYTLDNWIVRPSPRDQPFLAGYLLYQGDRPVAAIDTDAAWSYPVWMDMALREEDRLHIDLLTIILNDIRRVQTASGFAFLCPEVAKQQRVPRM